MQARENGETDLPPDPMVLSFWNPELSRGTTLCIAPENRLLVRLFPDGHLEYGPDYDPDDAARRFWEAIAQFAPRGIVFTSEQLEYIKHAVGYTQERLDGENPVASSILNHLSTTMP